MILVETEEQAKDLSSRLNGILIVLDVETHKTDQYYNKELLGVAIGIPNGLGLETYYVLPSVFPHCYEALLTCQWIGHNLKFDLEICYQNGLDFTGPIFDTQILVHLVDENQHSYELDWLGKVFVNKAKFPIGNFEKIFGAWHEIPPIIMGEYACVDLQITWELFLRFIGKLKEMDLEAVFESSMEYVRSLQLMIRSGIRVDRELVTVLSREAGDKISDLESQLAALGVANPGSTKQVRQYLYHDLGLPVKSWTTPKKVFGSGRKPAKPQPSVDNAAIEELIEFKPELEDDLKRITEWRQLTKAKSTWYDGFLTKMGSSDYLHPGLKQHGTKTGRLSCAEPNLQQIPRDSGRVKRIFIDTEDCSLVEFDYSQIELRIGAWFANKFHDPKMFNLYLEGADVHKTTAEMIGSIEALGYDEGRYIGKTGNFLWIYQGGAQRLQRMLWKDAKMRVDLAQCEYWTESFHRAYPGFMRVNKYAAEKSRINGYIKYWNGRKRRIKERNDRGQIKHYVAFNSAVQGGAGQILMYSVNELSGEQRRGAPIRLCSTVHDSLWVYILRNALEEGAELVNSIMVRNAELAFPGMTFKTDMKMFKDYRKEAA